MTQRFFVGAFFLFTIIFIPSFAFAAVGPNLIPNGNLESITGWNTVTGSTGLFGGFFGGRNSSSFTYPVTGVDGGKAAHITVNAYRNGGDIFWQPPNAPVTAGQQYQFSGYSRSNVSVVVIANYLNSNGRLVSSATLGTVSGNNTWQLFTSNITIPSGVTQVRVQHVMRSVGTLDIDNYSLGLITATPPPPPPPPAPPVISSFTATPGAIITGQSSTLAWTTTGATSLSINQGVGAVTGTSKSVSPLATTVYTLTAGNGTATTTASATVTVNAAPPPPAPTCTLSANPTSVTQGSASTLTFSSTNATSGTIDNGVGAVSTSGTKSVSPLATTLYTATFTGTGGTVTCSATVAVTAAPPPPPPPTNLITNGNLEAGTANNPTGWVADYWGTLTPTFTYPVTGNGGGKAAQVTVSNFSTGAAEWAFNHITDSTHTQYQYSEDYLATVPTELDIEFLMSDGTYQYAWLQTVPASATWQTLSAQVTPPTGAVSFSVLHVLAQNGSLTIDNASLSALNDPFAQGMVTFSFDDNLLSQFQNARPMLNAAGFKATYFVITQDPGTESGAMSWANLTTLKNEGNEIAGHTQTHPYLTQLTTAQMIAEVTGSFTDLVAQGFSPKTFAYPYGDVNAAVEQAVKTAGYLGARGSYYGLNGPVTDHYDLYDIRLDSTSNLTTIEQFIDQAKADKRWIDFEIHDVLASGGDTYSITPSFLQSVVNYVKASGVQVVTVQQGVAQLNP